MPPAILSDTSPAATPTSSSKLHTPHHTTAVHRSARACSRLLGAPNPRDMESVEQIAMFGRKRGGSTATATGRPPAEQDAGLTGGTTVAGQFVAQLDEAARERLDRMNQRLRLLEQQMEMLEAEVSKASTTDTDE